MNQQGVASPFVSLGNDILKKYFKGSDDLLFAMRAVMLDLNPTDAEKAMVKDAFSNKELYEVITQRFLPTLSKTAAIGQLQDTFLGLDQQIVGVPKEAIEQTDGMSNVSHNMMKAALLLLSDPDAPDKPNVRNWANTEIDPLQTELLGRNRFVRAVESQLVSIKVTANQVEQTPAAAAKNRNT